VPALPNVPKVVRLDHHLAMEGTPNMQIRGFYQYAGALSQADAQTWLTNIVTAFNTFVNARLSTRVSTVLAQLTDLTSTSAVQVQNSTSATGTDGNAANGPGVALVIKQVIARRYRGGHSRVYIPGTTAANITSTGRWDSTYLTNTVSAFTTYVNAVIANTNPAAIGAITHVNVSYFSGFHNVTFPSGRARAVPTARVTPLVDTIIALVGNPEPASQRRRNEQP
jgi:hypothetical protein